MHGLAREPGQILTEAALSDVSPVPPVSWPPFHTVLIDFLPSAFPACKSTLLMNPLLYWDCDRIAQNATDARFAPAARHARQQAELALDQPMLSVIHDENLFESAQPNDYRSFGPYWWPDPAKDDGLPWIRRDGDVNPASVGGCRTMLDTLKLTMEQLALGWLVTRDARFADHAAELVRTWFIHPHTRMNPHLEFGQAIPGKCTGRGIGIIDTYMVLQMLDAITITAGAGSLDKDEYHEIANWTSEYGRWVQTSKHGRDERATTNNHGTWYDVQVAGFALFSGREDDAREALTRLRDERIAKHIQPDGSQPHELGRTRSFDYSTMNLRGHLIGASMGRLVGIDIASPTTQSGRQLRDAVGFFKTYLTGLESWQWEQMVDTKPCQLASLLAFAAQVLDEPEYLAWSEQAFDYNVDCVHRLLHS